MKTKLSHAMFARWQQRAKPVNGGIKRSPNDNNNIVDFVVVHSISNRENLNVSIQNLFKVSKLEGL